MNRTPLDWSLLEEDPAFRIEALYFLRLAGTYAQSVFWDSFRYGRTKGGKARRRDIIQKAQRDLPESSRFRRMLENPADRSHQTLDPTERNFTGFLEGLPPPIRQKLAENMRFNHALFSGGTDAKAFSAYIRNLKVLQSRRDFLEHFEERSKKGERRSYNDETVARALGVFLLPEMLFQFRDMIRSARKRMAGTSHDTALYQTEAAVTSVFEDAIMQRKEQNRRLFSDQRSRKTLRHKKRRKALISPRQRWHRAFERHSPGGGGDYREFQFKTRYYFMGEQNFYAIRRALKDRNDAPLNFRHEIEPFYRATMEVTRLLHEALDSLPKNRNDKISGKGRTKAARLDLRRIRNEIAHNGLFWRVYASEAGPDFMAVEQVFKRVMQALEQEQGRSARLRLYDRLRSCLRRQNYAVTEEDQGRTRKIRRWRPGMQEAYGKSPFRKKDQAAVHMRRRVRRNVGRWQRALRRAHQAVEEEIS